MGETRYEVINTASKLLKASKTIGLRVNEEKTKYLMHAATDATSSIRRLIKSKLLSHNSKTLLYHNYLRPIITYASETWPLTKGDGKRLMTFERKVLRKIYGPKFNAESQTYERRKNQELQEANGQVIKEVLVNKINKKRPLGRPRTRWMDVIAQDIKNVEESSFDDAYDSEKWRNVKMAAMALNWPIS
ncbi:Hypothetical protein CINCED_3A012587 [Cinara cedri]|uniref:Reverse transcriptase domain n=1 Tax=Cinara cedri TaxID=506608 RepID=A0A5E4MTN6_9HEMI|nr:Hypothetical protein CINCED_3A012587 [Cinara cedri]